MKRLISMLLAAALAVGLSLPALAAEQDGPSSWAEAEVARALELGFVPEDLQGDYQKEVTRAEFAEFAIYFLAVQYGYPSYAKADYGNGRNYQIEDFLADYCDTQTDRFGVPFDIDDYDPNFLDTSFRWWTAFTKPEQFSDLNTLTVQSKGYVNAAYFLGLVNGTNAAATLFNPGGAITRQEAAAMLQRTYACYASSVPEAGALIYADSAAVADWAADSVALMGSWKVMSGTGSNTFDPLGTYTREQCIVTFMRLYDNAPEGRAQGTLAPLFTQAENVQRMMKLGIYGSSVLYRADAGTCTVLYVGYLRRSDVSSGTLYNDTRFRIIYTDGSYRTVPLEQGYGLEFRLSPDKTAVNFVRSIGGNPMSLDLATGALSVGFRE